MCTSVHVLLVEEEADGLVAMDTSNGFTKQRCHADRGQVVELRIGSVSTGICDDDPIDLGVVESFDGWPAEDTVRCADIDLLCSVVTDDFDSTGD